MEWATSEYVWHNGTLHALRGERSGAELSVRNLLPADIWHAPWSDLLLSALLLSALLLSALLLPDLLPFFFFGSFGGAFLNFSGMYFSWAASHCTLYACQCHDELMHPCLS